MRIKDKLYILHLLNLVEANLIKSDDYASISLLSTARDRIVNIEENYEKEEKYSKHYYVNLETGERSRDFDTRAELENALAVLSTDQRRNVIRSFSYRTVGERERELAKSEDGKARYRTTFKDGERKTEEL